MLYLPVINSQAASGDFCKQKQKWKLNVCLFMKNCNDSSNELLSFLRDVKNLKDFAANHVFNLRDPKNLNSVVDLYQELTTYTRIFHIFNSSMAAFYSKQTKAIRSVNNNVEKYFERLSFTIETLKQTTDKLVELNVSFHQASENNSFVGARCLNGPDSMHQCTYYVTDKLRNLLNQWENTCSTCTPSLKGISAGKKGGKGKKNKRNKKEKKRGKKGGKGKGKKQQKKNDNNKRNKAHEKKTQ